MTDGEASRRSSPLDFTTVAGVADAVTGEPSGHRQLPSTEPPLGSVPRLLLGRDGFKAELNSALRTGGDGKIVVLHGIAGGGKSSLALWLAVQARDQGVDVHWVRGGAVLQSMLAVAVAHGMDDAELGRMQTDPGRAREVVWRFLDAAPQRWLLVFDNIEDFRQENLLGDSGDHYDGTGWIRSGNGGLVVVTSRRGDTGPWGDAAVLHRISPLDSTAGAALLLESAPAAGTAAAASALSEQLGGLPLALRLAGSYLGDELARYRTFAAYGAAVRGDLELLDAVEPLPVDPDDDAAARRSVRLTWELSLRLLDDQGMPAARPLLHLLACYGAPHPIPIELLMAGPPLAVLGSPVAELTQTSVDRIVRTLHTFALVDNPHLPDELVSAPCVALHPLVAEVISAARDASIQREAVWTAALALLEEYTPNPLESEHEERWSVLPALCRHVLDRIADDPIDTLSGAVAFGIVCTLYLLRSGALPDAHTMSEQTLRRAVPLTTSHDREHAERHFTARFVAAVVNQTAGSAVVVAGELRALLADAQRMGFAGETVTAVRQQLAQSLAVNGANDEAEQIYLDLLEDHARGIAPEHETETRYGYGRLLDSMGRPGEAETELNRALDSRRARYPDDPEHVSILVVRTALASVWAGLGRIAAARAELESVLRVQEARYGPDKPQTLTTRVYLMGVLSLLHDTAGSEAQLGQVLRIQRDALNPEHPWAMAGFTMLLIKNVLSGQEDPEVAEYQLAEAADTIARIVGENNQLVWGVRLQAVRCRGTYDAEGASVAAAALVDDLIRLFPAENMLTPSAQLLRAQLALEIDDGPTAEAVSRDVLHAVLATFGPDYPQIVSVRVTLAKALRHNGDLAGCVEQLAEAVATARRIHGDDHEDTWQLRVILVRVHSERQHYVEAEAELLDLIGSMNAIGPDSDDALNGRVMLALLRADQGRLDEAERDLRDLLGFLHTLPVTGPESVYNIQIVRWLLAATIRTIGGRNSEAEELMTAVEAGLLELGDPGDDLITLRLELGELLHERGKFQQAERMLQLALGAIDAAYRDGPVARQLRRALTVVAEELNARPGSPEEPECDVGNPAVAQPDSSAIPVASTRAYLDGGPVRSAFSVVHAAPPPMPEPSQDVPEAPPSASASVDLLAELGEVDRARACAGDYRADWRQSARLTRLLGRSGLSGSDEALLRHRYALALDDHGFPLAALGQLTVACAIHGREHGRSSPDRLHCRVDAALIGSEWAGSRATAGLTPLLNELTEQLGSTHDLVLRLRRGRAESALAQRDTRAAHTDLTAVLAARTAHANSDDRETARVLADLAVVAELDGDLRTAEEMYATALSWVTARSEHYRSVLAIRAARLALGSTPDAVPQLRIIVREQLIRLGPGHPDAARTRMLIARSAAADQDMETARRELRTAVTIRRLRFGAAHPCTVAAEATLAELD